MESELLELIEARDTTATVLGRFSTDQPNWFFVQAASDALADAICVIAREVCSPDEPPTTKAKKTKN